MSWQILLVGLVRFLGARRKIPCTVRRRRVPEEVLKELGQVNAKTATVAVLPIRRTGELGDDVLGEDIDERKRGTLCVHRELG